MDLRLAVKEDIPNLVKLRVEYLKVEKPEMNALKEGLLALSLGNYFMRHLSSGDLVCWVAEFEGREAERRNVSLITVQDGEMGKGGNRNFVLYRKV